MKTSARNFPTQSLDQETYGKICSLCLFSLFYIIDFLRPHIMSKVALTQGQWSVIDKDIWLDEVNGFVYFHGLRETPLEKHLYVVSIDQPCNVRRLTTSGYSHTAYLNQVRLNLHSSHNTSGLRLILSL